LWPIWKFKFNKHHAEFVPQENVEQKAQMHSSTFLAGKFSCNPKNTSLQLAPLKQENCFLKRMSFILPEFSEPEDAS
jgi:hypothetical protein